jgi:hypothetical protein
MRVIVGKTVALIVMVEIVNGIDVGAAAVKTEDAVIAIEIVLDIANIVAGRPSR